MSDLPVTTSASNGSISTRVDLVHNVTGFSALGRDTAVAPELPTHVGAVNGGLRNRAWSFHGNYRALDQKE